MVAAKQQFISNTNRKFGSGTYLFFHRATCCKDVPVIRTVYHLDWYVPLASAINRLIEVGVGQQAGTVSGCRGSPHVTGLAQKHSISKKAGATHTRHTCTRRATHTRHTSTTVLDARHTCPSKVGAKYGVLYRPRRTSIFTSKSYEG